MLDLYLIAVDFDYPDFEETFMKPKPAKSDTMDTSSPSASLPSINGAINVELSGNLPRIDRSTKPKIDRSTKSNAITIQVTKSKSDSLYPDVGVAINGPGTSQNRDTSEANFRNADSRADSFSTGISRAANGDMKNISRSNLSGQSSEHSDELKELELQKREKMEEIRKLQEKYEMDETESRTRMEKVRLEEKRLSDLEDLKRKQQKDVADLMRYGCRCSHNGYPLMSLVYG